jgi:hypothetical protein
MPFLRHCSLVISPHWADPTISPRVGDFPSLRFCADCSGVCPSASSQKCHVQTSSNSPNSILLLVKKLFFFIEVPSFVGSYLGQLPQKVVPRFASLLGDEWGHHIDKCKLSRRFPFLDDFDHAYHYPTCVSYISIHNLHHHPGLLVKPC